MLRLHLEADEEGVLGSDGLTVEEYVLLHAHHLFESLQVQRASPAPKKLRTLHVRVKFVKHIWLGAIASVEEVKLLHVLSALAKCSLLHPKNIFIT